MILLIDNYDSFTYNLLHYVQELGTGCSVYRNDKISLTDIKKLKPKAIIISPGPGTPDQSGICLDVIKELTTLPILGVCLGHQAIGQIMGAKVIRAPYQMHGKVSQIYHDGTGVFKNIPSPFEATRYHSLIVEKKSLPDSLEITAQTDDELIMGLAHKDRPLHGVQFHPESIRSEYGHQILANFLLLAGVKLKPMKQLKEKIIS